MGLTYITFIVVVQMNNSELIKINKKKLFVSQKNQKSFEGILGNFLFQKKKKKEKEKKFQIRGNL